MCTGLEPLLIGSLILSAGGSLLQQSAASKNAEAQAKARNRVLSTFLDKNERLSEEARGVLSKRLAQEETDPNAATQPLQQRREADAGAVLDRATTSAPIQLSGNAPKVVADEASKAQSATDAEARARSANLAGVRSFGDLLFNKALATDAAGRQIGTISRFAQADAQNLPILQDLAQQKASSKGRGLGVLGSVLGALGSLGSAAAGSGVLSGAGGAGVTTQATNPFNASLFNANGTVALPNLGL